MELLKSKLAKLDEEMSQDEDLPLWFVLWFICYEQPPLSLTAPAFLFIPQNAQIHSIFRFKAELHDAPGHINKLATIFLLEYSFEMHWWNIFVV